MIQFQQLNLLDASYPVKGPLDVIFCRNVMIYFCLLYTSDAADERSSVDLGGRRIIKKKKYI